LKITEEQKTKLLNSHNKNIFLSNHTRNRQFAERMENFHKGFSVLRARKARGQSILDKTKYDLDSSHIQGKIEGLEQFPTNSFQDYYREFLKRRHQLVLLDSKRKEFSNLSERGSTRDLLDTSSRQLPVRRLKNSFSQPVLVYRGSENFENKSLLKPQLKISDLKNKISVLKNDGSDLIGGKDLFSERNPKFQPEKVTKVRAKSKSSLKSSVDNLSKNKLEDSNFIDQRTSLSLQKRKNYLPTIRGFLEKHRVKQSDLEKIMTKDISKKEKCDLLKVHIGKIEEKAKLYKRKLKHSRLNEDLESEKNTIDQYYVDSIKSKLALLNQMHTGL